MHNQGIGMCIIFNEILAKFYRYGMIINDKPPDFQRRSLPMPAKKEFTKEQLRYLRLLAKQYPTVHAASKEI